MQLVLVHLLLVEVLVIVLLLLLLAGRRSGLADSLVLQVVVPVLLGVMLLVLVLLARLQAHITVCLCAPLAPLLVAADQARAGRRTGAAPATSGHHVQIVVVVRHVRRGHYAR